MREILANKIRCKKCVDIIESKSVYDFRLNILVRQSRLSGFIRATVPVIGSHQKCYAA